MYCPVLGGSCVPPCESLCEPPGSSWWWAQHSFWSGPAGSSGFLWAHVEPELGWYAGKNSGMGNQLLVERFLLEIHIFIQFSITFLRLSEVWYPLVPVPHTNIHTILWNDNNHTLKEAHTLCCHITYIFVTKCLQQEEKDGFKVFIPHSQTVFSCDLQQIHQGAFTFLRALVMIGQLLQQVGYQVWVVLTDCLTREVERNMLHIIFFIIILSRPVERSQPTLKNLTRFQCER